MDLKVIKNKRKMALRMVAIFLLTGLGLVNSNAYAEPKVTGRSSNTTKVVSKTSKKTSKSTSAMKKTIDFDKPDFAFPRQVMNVANEEYIRAKAGKNWSRAFKALMQQCKVEELLHEEGADSCMVILRKAYNDFPAPYTGLLSLLEATILTDVYNADRYVISQRNIPDSSRPESIYLWDKKMYETAITDLIRKANVEVSGSEDQPLRQYSEIISNTNVNSTKGFTLGDFVKMKSIDLLDNLGVSQQGNRIPFKVSGAEAYNSDNLSQGWKLKSDLLQNWIATLKQSTPAPLAMIILQTDYRNSASSDDIDRGLDYWKSRVEFFSGSETQQGVLSEWGNLINSVTGRYGDYNQKAYAAAAEFMKLAEKSLADYPKGFFAPNLENTKNSLIEPSVSIDYKRQYLPEKNIEVKVSNRNQSSFRLHILRLPDSMAGKNITKGEAAKYGKPVGAVEIVSWKEKPFRQDSTISLGSYPAGYYALIESRGKTLSVNAQESRYDAQTFRVSDIALIGQRSIGAGNHLFVVDGEYSDPIEGAKVEFFQQIPYRERKNNQQYRLVGESLTDSDGLASIDPEIPDVRQVKVTKNKEAIEANIQLSPLSRQTENDELKASVFFDRSIAKPGEILDFELVTYSKQGNNLRAKEIKDLSLVLSNASGVEVDTLKLSTDERGYVSSTLRIPEKGMLGSWGIMIFENSQNKGKLIGWNSIRVEEYKTPTFQVIVDTENETGEPGASEEIIIKGKAMTFSGMPVGGANVDLNISWRPFRFRRGVLGSGDFAATTVTDAEGNFRIVLDAAPLAGTRYENSAFQYSVSVTSPAGETQRASDSFSLGTGYYLDASIPSQMEVKSDKIEFNVKVCDMLGHPQIKPVAYEISAISESEDYTLEEIIKEGTFISPELSIPANELPSGKYRLSFSLPGEDNSATQDVVTVIWRRNDQKPPFQTSLWVPITTITAEENQTQIPVTFGSAYNNQKVLCVVSDPNGELSRGWYTPDGRNINLTAPCPKENSRIFVELFTVHNLKPENEIITILPASENKKLKCETVTFRDKLSAGKNENWKFRFTKGGDAASAVSAFSVLSDKALNSLENFRWSFNPLSGLNYSQGSVLRWWNVGSRTLYCHFSGPEYKPTNDVNTPEWIYSFNAFMNKEAVFYSVEATSAPMMARNMKLRGTSSSEMIVNAMDVSDEAKEESAVDDYEAEKGEAGNSRDSLSAGAGNVNGSLSTENIKLRQAEMPVAFFRPNLRANKDGIVEIDFEVPDFNTTWQFQLLGYTPDMETAYLTLDAVSAKPVMVQTNTPRFVRTGDRIVLSATAYNNTDKTLLLGGKLEVADALSGKLICSKEFKGTEVGASGSRLLNMEFTVPADLQYLVLRSYAISDGNSDGEQSPLVVLPASSPVIESKPFYLSAGENEYRLRLPEFKNGGSATLTYCDNPIWYVLTSLPSLTEDKGISVISLMKSLYGSSIGYGLIGRYPELKKGLSEIIEADNKGETTILNSPLENNEQLKSIALSETPWVNNAKSQNLRLQSLGNLLNEEEGRNVINSITDKMLSYQRYDGGFAWCPDGESSEWATGQVLLYSSMLGRFGYMPSSPEYRKALTSALGFIEHKWLERIEKNKKDASYIESLRNLLYIRSYYVRAGMLPKESSEFRKYASQCLEMVAKNWRNYSIYDKATSATLLCREGKQKAAEEIVSSLSEYASGSKEKGMWFDSLSGSNYSPWNKLITTAQALEAFVDVDPSSADVDLIRQWLILQCQAEDWGTLPYGAELIQAILSSGSDWCRSEGKLRIKIGGKDITDISKLPEYGEITITLDPKKSSGKELLISRASSGPAWGGVISQYVAPIETIKAESTSDVKITKDIYLLREVGGVMTPVAIDSENQPEKGDLVRVLLTVVIDRDMEYVAVKDERSACLEPIDQLSGSTVIDGVWLYREIRNSETNLFIPFISKGSYQISYDCRLSQEGDFSTGIATLQSQYAPTLTGHSAGRLLEVK